MDTYCFYHLNIGHGYSSNFCIKEARRVVYIELCVCVCVCIYIDVWLNSRKLRARDESYKQEGNSETS